MCVDVVRIEEAFGGAARRGGIGTARAEAEDGHQAAEEQAEARGAGRRPLVRSGGGWYRRPLVGSGGGCYHRAPYADKDGAGRNRRRQPLRHVPASRTTRLAPH